jgi:hydroxymethylpyrimidine/phosphomethylpyrimidine kinase
MPPPIVLSIAGFDPTSGAGITADLKTAAAHGCYAITCITALTVQTTERVYAVEPVREDFVRDTLFELVRDMPPQAVKIGMLANGAVAEVVADFLETVRPPNVILDPILRATSGSRLLDESGENVLRERLLKLADVVTPNVDEAAIIQELTSGKIYSNGRLMAAELLTLAGGLHALGAGAVVITGGHLPEASDLLSVAAGEAAQIEWFTGPRIESRATHGTGCAFSTAIACNLANGLELRAAVVEAKAYVRQAIENAEELGHGHGPMNHLFQR